MAASQNKIGLSETLIEDEIGCGYFQVLMVVLVFISVKMSGLFSFLLMSYGSYNPGWRCTDNVNITELQISLNNENSSLYSNYNSSTNLKQSYNITNSSSLSISRQYHIDQKYCEIFEKCNKIEFNPDSLTIVSEWGLVCDKAWISSFMISIQLSGNLIGSVFAGQVADAVGRKPTLYYSILINTCLTIAAIFSPGWQIFAAINVLSGICTAFFDSMNYTYPAEFLPRKWRGPLVGIPAWGIAGIIYGVVCMSLRNWKHILIVRAVLSAICLIPAWWVPESLRWLEAKHKVEDFKNVARKMALCNRIRLTQLDISSGSTLDVTSDDNADYGDDNKDNDNDKNRKPAIRRHNLLDLFRHGYFRTTIIVGFNWLCFTLIYTSVNFGIRAFSGNFYINFITMFAVMTPFTVFPIIAPNILGRGKSAILFMAIAAICLIAATIFERLSSNNLETYSTLILVVLAHACVDTTWCIQQIHVIELYPTVARGLAINWASLMSRFGGVVAPFIIPNDSSNKYVWYLVMACICVGCCGLISRLRETKGQPLRLTF